jgi:hypothetical protein
MAEWFVPIGVGIGPPGFTLAVMIQSAGQPPKAHLDCSMYGSPFLQ